MRRDGHLTNDALNESVGVRFAAVPDLSVDGQQHAFQLVGGEWATDEESAAVRNARKHLRSRDAPALHVRDRARRVQLEAASTMKSFTASA